MSTNRRLIDSKWVLNKKRDGRFRARLVARGYTKIPGVDFTNNYSSVITEVSLCFIILILLIKYWESHTIYIDFIYAVLEEEIYMKIPEGIAEVLEE